MYNSDLPTRADLPSNARLLRSTIVAAITAALLLVLIVLPSEYAVDPTGVGRVMGLTQRGEIKMQLAEEAEADRQAVNAPVAIAPANDDRLDAIERQLAEIRLLLAMRPETSSSDSIGAVLSRDEVAALAQPAEPEPVQPSGWQDEISITLQPGEGVEYKLVMAEGAAAEFEWTANGSVLNYDTHGDGNGNSVSYERGRAVPGQTGTLEAAFTGNHGWFWRNRTEVPVTLTLRTRGDYAELIRTV